MDKGKLITLRRALLNYRELLINEELEGFRENGDWTTEDWKRELENVAALLEEIQV